MNLFQCAIAMLLFDTGGAASGGWKARLFEWFDTYLNYPGLEAWKFINLGIFLAVGIFILRRPLREALAARRETIRVLLIDAEKERDLAQASLSEAESLVARIDTDVAAVREQAKKEAQLERQRLEAATEKEIEKMRYQADREIQTAAKVAKKELQKFLARRSVELARENVRSQIRPEDDTRLIQESIGQLRRTGA
jgi:F-type H+-transporting ATPase subunit b